MKTRTNRRILSILLSMLMCIWMMQPVPIWAAGEASPNDATVTVSGSAETDSASDVLPSSDDTQPADQTDTESNLKLLDSTGAPAESGYSEKDNHITVTESGTWTAVVEGKESPTGLLVAAGFHGILTVRNTDKASGGTLAERIFLFDGTAADAISLSAVTASVSGSKLTDSQGQNVPVFPMEHAEGITSLHIDDTSFTMGAVPSGAALYLVPKAADHTVTFSRGDSAQETLKITWNGSAFALRTQKENEWTIAPSMKDWTYGQTASTPAGQAKYGEVLFTYAASPDGTFGTEVPSNAGAWYLKAEVTATDDHTGLSEIVPFTIHQAESTVAITTESLDKIYDGNPAAAPEVQKTGSTNDVHFLWQQKNASQWNDLTEVPAHAGEYKVIATVEGDTNHTSASAEKTFTITAAENTWTEPPAVSDTAYGTAPAPTAKAAFGAVQFTYSSTKDGAYDELPADAPAGTWYLKAEVPATGDYSGLSAILEFRITKAAAPALTLPDPLTAEQDSLLSTLTLPGGWTWADGRQKVSAGNNGYPARLTVDDRNYDYTSVDGYNADGHYVERLIPVAVTRGKNTWTEALTIKDWIYGQKPSTPTAKAAHGDVTFTYSAAMDGTFTEEVPTQAGIWYVKATVPASDAYEELTQIAEFVIHKADPSPKRPDLEAFYGQKLNSISLPKGFTWDYPDLPVGDVGNQLFTVTYTPEDTANYETLTNFTLAVVVKQAENTWTEEPAIKGWTYGSKANTPTAKTAFGTPYFLYSAKADGTYTSTVPANAGTWYLKAVTDGTDNYKELTSKAVAFTIEPKSYEEKGSITIPKIDSSTDISKLEIKDGDTTLKQGTDYEVKKTLKDKTMSVTITFKGNYKGTVVRTYTATEKEIEAYKAAQQVKSVQTGDRNMTEVWAALTILSLAAVLLLICILRVRKKNRELTDF